MTNPDTIPCSIDRLFNLPSQKPQPFVAPKPRRVKPTKVIVARVPIIDPLIAPGVLSGTPPEIPITPPEIPILPPVLLPTLTAHAPVLITTKGNGKSNGSWKELLIFFVVVIAGIVLAKRINDNSEKKKNIHVSN